MSTFSKPSIGVSFAEDSYPPGPIEPTQALWANDNPRRIVAAVLLAVLCIGVGLVPLATGSFLPADALTVTQNPMLYNWANLRAVWESPQNLPQLSPMGYSLLLIQNQLFQDHAAGYRLISLALHITNALLLLRLLNRLELPGAWLGAALFALHPVQVDTVCWISQQRYLSCGVFYLSALLFYLRRVGLNPTPPVPVPGNEPLIPLSLPQNPLWLYVFSMLLFLAALLCHVIAGTFPLVVLILIWWERGSLKKSDILPLILPATLALLLVGLMARVNWGHGGELWTTFAGWQWFLYIGRGAWVGLLEIILPISLSFSHTRWDQPPPQAWQVVLLLGVFLVIFLLWRARDRWGRGPFASALLFCALLLPAAFGVNDPNPGSGIQFADHDLYFAVAAVTVPVAALLMEWLARRPRAIALLSHASTIPTAAIVVGLLVVIASGIHSASYASSITAWQQVLRSDANSDVALNALGELEFENHDNNLAATHFRSAFASAPGDPASLYHLAQVAYSEKQYARAIGLYDLILSKHPEEIDARLQLADALVAQGNTVDGLAEYQQVLKLRPHNATIYNQLGLIHAQRGEVDEALASYRMAVEIDPKMAIAYLNMANSLFQLGRYQDAKDALESVIKIDPHNYVVWMNAGVMASSVGDLESGEKYFHLAMYYNLKNPDACIDLGKVLMRWGAVPGKKSRVDEAIAYFKRALSLEPDNADAKINLDAAQRQRDYELQQGHH